jgi:peptidoglycan/LPS O-acetylase OafA/YrhL
VYKQIRYFKGLNGLRFFAAYLVVLHHAEQIRLKNDIFHLKDLPLFNNGSYAVTFFFVLSGFLISNLLLKEQVVTGTISIQKFYMNRILRICPLYFLLVILGTIIIPYFLTTINHSYEMPYTFKDVVLYYVFFSPFMVNILFGHHLLEPLWSIGVEELFYIIWAPLFKFLKRYILVITLSVITLKILLIIASDTFLFPSTLSKIIKMLKFESIAVGGLTAYIIYHRKKKIEDTILFSKLIQIVIFLFLIGKFFISKFLIQSLFFFEFLYNSNIFSHMILSCSFAWLVVNISLNRKSIISLDNRLFNFLGEISYGIYMYHMLIIFGIIVLLKDYLATMSGLSSTAFFYLLLTTGVIFVSTISKRIFEDYFLRLKVNFRIIQHTTKDHETYEIREINEPKGY